MMADYYTKDSQQRMLEMITLKNKARFILKTMMIAGISMVGVSIAAGQEATVMTLSGTDWRIHEDADGTGVERKMFDADPSGAGWIVARVPGNIQADLEAAHLLKPLWYGAGDARLYDVARKDWWYRKDFFAPETFKDRRLTLVFDGVDYECDVWLNGKQIGRNAGMFRRFQFDVTEYVKTGQTNLLAVKIAKIPESLASTIIGSDGANSNVPPVGADASESVNFLNGINKMRQTLKDLKSPTNYGWDWGVNIWTLGIWKDVRLEASGPVRIDWTQVQTKLNADYTKATISAALEVDSLAEQPVKASFRILGNGQDVEVTVDVALIKGGNTIKAEVPLDHPALWWCNGRGKQQPLYTLAAQLLSADGTVIDSRSTRFGVREVKWVHTEGAAKDFISRYQLVLNGQPVRTLGSNIIPPDLLFGRSEHRALHLLRMAQAAGMNMMRVWGGGVILSDDFYALADELGVMLSVEMPLANCMPEKDGVFLRNLEKTIVNIVKQVRNHPAIIEYTGGNEMYWRSDTVHPAWDVLQKVVREGDDRLIRATCPDLGARHNPWDFDVKTSYAHYNKINTMRYGEFGVQTPANLEVWHRTIPPKSQWPIGADDPILIRKNVVQAVFTPEHWLLKNRIDSLFGALDNLPDLIRAGQFYGAEGLRYAIDANRRKGRRMGGCTTWDFNEPWLNGAGSYQVDYDGRTLMNYDFVKQALAPISLSLKYDTILYDPAAGVGFEVWLTSDALETAKNVKWTLLARDRRGNVFAREQGIESIEPLQVKQVKVLQLTPPEETRRGPVFIELQLADAQGKLLVERLHVFSADGLGSLSGLLVNREKDTDDEDVAEAAPVEKPNGKSNLAFVGNGARRATASSAMSNTKHQPPSGGSPVRRTELSVTALPIKVEGDQEVLDLVVENTGKMTALFCEPHPLIEYRTDLVINNNHCFIPPEEKRTITIRSSAKPAGGLTLAQTGWRISTWNADDVVMEPDESVLLAVGRRDQMCREFVGYFDKDRDKRVKKTSFEGTYPDASQLFYLADDKNPVRFEFTVSEAQVKRGARLRIHTADQSKDVSAQVQVTVNGTSFERALPPGIGLQRTDPSHLAFTSILTFEIPSGLLQSGKNIVDIQVKNGGWFTWDGLDLEQNIDGGLLH
jgi:beta-mannosidase